MIEPVVLRPPIALLFPGQGVQAPGMGKSLYDRYDAARRVFAAAEDITGMPLRQVCFDGPAETLNRTEILQPAVVTVCWAAYEVWLDRAETQDVVLTAGHSLGEISAFAAAGAISWADAVALVKERGRIMEAAGRRHGGGMIAIVGLGEEQVRSVMAAASSEGGELWIANRNSVEQFVLSGRLPAIQAAEALALEAGARRALILTIPLAAHTPLMAEAAREFQVEVDRLDFSAPTVPVLANADGSPLRTADELRAELREQMLRQVDWTSTMRSMHEAGIRTAVELGPGRVLASLATKHYEEMQSWNAEELLVQFAEGAPAAT